jgi:hypothetical protein
MYSSLSEEAGGKKLKVFLVINILLYVFAGAVSCLIVSKYILS